MDYLYIIKAEYLDGLILRIWFNDHTEKIVDFSSFLIHHPHPQYNKYNKISNFKKFYIRNGNLIWGKHADLSFPIEALYEGDLELCY